MINAHRLDAAANQLAEQLATNTPSGSPRQEAQELLASLRDYRTRAAAAGQHQAETDAELIWTLENALTAALEPEHDEPTPTQKALAHEPGWTARILAAKLAADQATAYAQHANDEAAKAQQEANNATEHLRAYKARKEEARARAAKAQAAHEELVRAHGRTIANANG